MARLTSAQNFETRFARAAERAAAKPLSIVSVNALTFVVTSENGTYTVTITSLSKNIAACECKGAQRGYVCKHMVAVFQYIGILDGDGNRAC